MFTAALGCPGHAGAPAPVESLELSGTDRFALTDCPASVLSETSVVFDMVRVPRETEDRKAVDTCGPYDS